MKQSLRPGISNVKRFSVDRDRTISFMGEEGRVYATPSLVRDMEHTCRELLMDHADDGKIQSASRFRCAISRRRFRTWRLRSPRR